MFELLAKQIHQNNKEKGFWDGEITHDKLGNKIALIHSEATELLEALRKQEGSAATVGEIADIIIRTLDIYQGMRDADIVTDSLDEIFEAKVEFNKGRPYRHGHHWPA
jgi:NTP pyrophosphatase (non-canonical NTP hydrolase)